VSTPEPAPEKSSRAPVIAALVTLGLVLAIAFGSWLVRDDQLYPGTDGASPSASQDGAQDTDAVELSLPTQESARCMPVDAETLGRAEAAFDGEVLSVDGETVTLAVRQWYAGGDDAAQVRLDLASVPSTLAGYFDFQDGRRYLVSANDDTVLACGFSGPWSSDLEMIYADAFPAS
jgi:hypothetical protein